MASVSDMNITFEIEPVVKLVCSAFECKHNLAMRYAQVGMFCNLKNVAIGEGHQCAQYEPEKKSLDNINAVLVDDPRFTSG